jgi:DnaJ-class molecular chaperone
MPIFDKLDMSLNGAPTCAKGNLYIKFDISFPKTLNKEQKQKVVALC